MTCPVSSFVYDLQRQSISYARCVGVMPLNISVFVLIDQCLAIWDWTVEGETPVASIEISPKYGQQVISVF